MVDSLELADTGLFEGTRLTNGGFSSKTRFPSPVFVALATGLAETEARALGLSVPAATTILPETFSEKLLERQGSDFLPLGKFAVTVDVTLVLAATGLADKVRVILSLWASSLSLFCFSSLQLSLSLRNRMLDTLSAAKHCSCRGFEDFLSPMCIFE